jgi:hypothetical protein
MEDNKNNSLPLLVLLLDPGWIKLGSGINIPDLQFCIESCQFQSRIQKSHRLNRTKSQTNLNVRGASKIKLKKVKKKRTVTVRRVIIF